MFNFLADAPRHFFFTGKGGVGKTSIACATAVRLARQGKRVLLVSTDPASNVAQVFGVTIGNKVTQIPAVPGLAALEINPDQAAAAYRDKILEPVRAILPIKEIEAITEQLSGSCTTEIASFNEFTDLLADPEMTRDYDHVIFDTAPTGHTIRLLQLPGNWTSYLDNGKGNASCLGPMSGLEKNRATYRAAVQALTDPTRTRLVLIARAQQSTLHEVELKSVNMVGLDALEALLDERVDVAAAEEPQTSGNDVTMYRDRVMASKGAKLDEAGRAALADRHRQSRTSQVLVHRRHHPRWDSARSAIRFQGRCVRTNPLRLRLGMLNASSATRWRRVVSAPSASAIHTSPSGCWSRL